MGKAERENLQKKQGMKSTLNQLQAQIQQARETSQQLESWLNKNLFSVAGEAYFDVKITAGLGSVYITLEDTPHVTELCHSIVNHIEEHGPITIDEALTFEV